MKTLLLLPTVILLTGCFASYQEFLDEPSPVVSKPPPVVPEPPKPKTAEQLEAYQSLLAGKEIGQSLKDMEEGKITPRQITEEEQKIVGTYELKGDELPERAVFLDNGGVKIYADDKLEQAFYWRIEGGEVHVGLSDKLVKLYLSLNQDESIADLMSLAIIKIEPNGDLTLIAQIDDGKRKDLPKDEQFTGKKN